MEVLVRFGLPVSKYMKGGLQMERRYLKESNGHYEVDIDISVDEWKSMLQNHEIFYENALDMVLKWYNEVGHQATANTVKEKYSPELKRPPYNGIVKELTRRILKHLNRFEVIGTTGKKSVFIVPFEGWYVDYKRPNKGFVWKLRDELVQALEEVGMVDRQIFLSKEYLDKKEQENINKAFQLSIYELEKKIDAKTKKQTLKTTSAASVRYDRDPDVSALALKKANGYCQLCGNLAPFLKKDGTPFLEVHHIRWLSEGGVDDKTNTVALCPNCHRKMHILDLQDDRDFLINSIK
ncbi:HNH endonuclease [Methanosarcina barkeri]|nr:HNH endonuclease [Methanosarcina barkeri]